MYENLSEKRKQELDTLREWAVCAGDDYYFSMAQSDFEKSMKGCENEEFFRHTHVSEKLEWKNLPMKYQGK